LPETIENVENVIQCDSKPVFYCGGWSVMRELPPDTVNTLPMGRCLTPSVNIARRYGPIVCAFELKSCTLGCLSFEQLYRGTDSLFADVDVDALLFAGSRERYDHPVDMLLVRNPKILTFSRVLTVEELHLLDDGLPLLNQPMGPADKGWDVWVAQMQNEDLAGALEDAGWRTGDSSYSYCLTSDGYERDWIVRVFSAAGPVPLEFGEVPEDSWLIETNFGETAVATTLIDALVSADIWSRQHRLEREARRHPVPVLAGNTQEAERDTDDMVPF
jgi:hypothetical protein